MRRALARLPLVALGLLLAGGCASKPQSPPAALLVRPEWRVGDRWVFRATQPMGPETVVVHEVVEATAEGYAVRMGRLNQTIVRYWTRELHLSRQTMNGRPLNRFEPPAMYFSWPLALGKTWSQEFDYQDGRTDGRYENRWRVGERVEPVDVMAGPFGTLRIDRLGGDGALLDSYWWVPQARYWVRFVDHRTGYAEELVELPPGSP